jgi:acetoacetate decarboxylase
MAIPLDRIANMPAFSPYYPMPPARYRNVRFQYVYFRADVSAIEQVLPACFEPSEDGFCAAVGIAVPWSANYGRFEESLLIVKCRYEDQIGYFAPVVFLNSRSSIPAGREIYGTPKVFADIEVGMDERVMYTDTRLAGVSVMQIIDGAKASSEVTVHTCRAGDGVVQFNPSPIYDLSDFTPREYYGAHYLEMDYTEGYAEIVHDFLHGT